VFILIFLLLKLLDKITVNIFEAKAGHDHCTSSAVYSFKVRIFEPCHDKTNIMGKSRETDREQH
jgi:hypothetical protein